MPFFLSRCPPSTKSGVGFYEDRGSSWPQVNPACPLTLNPYQHLVNPVQLFGRYSWLKTQPKQAKWAQIAHETESSWPSWWTLNLPTSFPALSTLWGWFLPLTVSHFDLPGPWYAVAKAQNGNFVDGSRAVWPATRAKCQNGKNFFPPGTFTLVAWWWAKKNTFCTLWPCGFKVERIKKWCKSAKFWGRFGGRLTFWPPTQSKKVRIQMWFPPEPWLCWLDYGHFGHSSQGHKRLKFHQNVALCGGFWSSVKSVGIFFWHFSLLVPASLRSAGN